MHVNRKGLSFHLAFSQPRRKSPLAVYVLHQHRHAWYPLPSSDRVQIATRLMPWREEGGVEAEKHDMNSSRFQHLCSDPPAWFPFPASIKTLPDYSIRQLDLLRLSSPYREPHIANASRQPPRNRSPNCIIQAITRPLTYLH